MKPQFESLEVKTTVDRNVIRWLVGAMLLAGLALFFVSCTSDQTQRVHQAQVSLDEEKAAVAAELASGAITAEQAGMRLMQAYQRWAEELKATTEAAKEGFDWRNLASQALLVLLGGGITGVATYKKTMKVRGPVRHVAALLLVPLAALPLLGAQAPPAQEHGDPGTNPGALVVDECTRRFVGRHGEFLTGPRIETRVYDALDVTGADTLDIEQCHRHVWDHHVENLAPLGDGFWAYSSQTVRLDVFLNGTHLYQKTLTPTPAQFGNLAPYDGLQDFTGPSGSFGFGEDRITGGHLSLPMTPELAAIVSQPFAVTVVSSGSSTETISGGVHGGNANYEGTQFYWQGGIVFRAVDQPAP